MTTIGHETNPSGATRRQLRVVQAIVAGAATIATLALFSPAQPSDANSASGSVPGIAVAPVDDTNFVNDQGQTSGDIFTQNAQDQSTASGAGTN